MNRTISLAGNCATIYGPVQSRRHGLSLGINLGDAESKICTWGCVYCQCGFGKRAGESENLPEPRDVLERLERALAKYPALDSVTIAGNSEPTCHPRFAEIVDGVLDLRKRLGRRWIFNCLSNGSELHREEVQRACDRLDEIWIKLDCATPGLFRRLSRPIERIGTIDEHIARIRFLRQPWLQTLLWDAPGRGELGNMQPDNLDALLKAYREIGPAMVHITTIRRATAMDGLAPVPLDRLEQFAIRVRALGIDCAAFA